MKTKHTPGPWVMSMGTPYDNRAVILDNPTMPKGRRCRVCKAIATVNIQVLMDEQEGLANAHLIAAAPDMLEVLNDLVDRGLIIDPDNDHYDDMLKVLTKAIGGE